MGNRILYYQRFLYDLPGQGFGPVPVTFVSASWLSSVQFFSCVQLFVSPWTAACQASLSSVISRSLLKVMSIDSVVLSNHLIICCPSPFAFSLSQHQCLFQCVGSWHQVAKVLELQLQHQSFKWIFRVDGTEISPLNAALPDLLIVGCH